jgi:hypothetical protein
VSRHVGRRARQVLAWYQTFADHLPYTDPRILDLARDFSQEQRNIVRNIAGDFWYGVRDPWLNPASVEDAIAIAVVAVFEDMNGLTSSDAIH